VQLKDARAQQQHRKLTTLLPAKKHRRHCINVNMPAKGMMLGMTAVLLTLMAGAGKVHDGAPGRDGTGNHQLGDEEEEGEEMGEEESANDEK
jgi:hypothetical protein